MSSCSACTHASRMYRRASWLRALSCAVSPARSAGCNGVSPVLRGPLCLSQKLARAGGLRGEQGNQRLIRGFRRASRGTPSLLPAAEERNALLGFLGLRLGSLALLPPGVLDTLDHTGVLTYAP